MTLTKGQEHADRGQACCEERYREHALRQRSQRVNMLGVRLVAIVQPV
jgi:hypothetical protein